MESLGESLPAVRCAPIPVRHALAGWRRRRLRSLCAAIAVVSCLIAVGGASGNASDTPIPTPVVSGGAVNALAIAGSTAYLGGTFKYVGGTAVGSFIGLNSATGALASSSPRVIAEQITGMTDDGAGGWYLGGVISINGTATSGRIVHVLADGTVDPGFNVIAGHTVLLRHGSTLYVGGDLLFISGANGTFTRSHLGAIDTTTGAVTGWNPDVRGPSGTRVSVDSLAISGTTLYAGGAFTTVNGSTPRNRLAAFDTATGTATGFDPNVSGNVTALAVSDSTVFAGGAFSSVNGTTARQNLAAFDGTTGAATTWNPGANGSVSALAVSGSTVYAGGAFSTVNGSTSRLRAAAFSATTGTATSWDPRIGSPSLFGSVNSLAVAESTVYIGGSFTALNSPSATRDNVAAVDATSGSATSFSPVVGGTVNEVGVSGSTVYVAGSFVSLGGTHRQGLAAVDLTTGALTGWDPMQRAGGNLNPGASVHAIAPAGSMIYVGGAIIPLGGGAFGGLTAFDATTGDTTAFAPSLSGGQRTIRALAVSGSTVYAGGSFTNVNGSARNNLAALDATSGAPTSWDPDVGGAVLALAVNGSTVYAGGAFTTVNGTTMRNNLAAFSAATGTATSFDPNIGGFVGANSDTSVATLAVSGSIVYVGGNFSTVNGLLTRPGLASVDASSGVATGWQPLAIDSQGVFFNEPVNELALAGSSIYVAAGGGGYFGAAATGPFALLGRLTAASDSSRHQGVATFDTTTGAVRSWNPRADVPSDVEAVALAAPYVALGFGTNFSSSQALNNGAVIQGAFAAFTLTPDPPPVTGHAISGHIWANGPGSPVAQASITACPTPADTPCRLATSGADGAYSLTNLPDHTSGGGVADHTWSLLVSPPSTAGLRTGTAGPIGVAGSDVSDVDVTLGAPTPLPPGASVTTPSDGTQTSGTPTVNWHDPTALRVDGCVGGTGTATLFHGPDAFSDEYTQTLPLTEGPAGSYTATFDPVFPHRGIANLSWTINCGGSASTGAFNIYIDPSGVVQTTGGALIVGATVTLLRADDPAGPFAPVPDGSSIMSPGNQKNPDTTNAVGHFGWDVVAGYYQVKATATGCHAPGNPAQPAVFSAVLTIPPPVTDLVLVLDCGATETTAPQISCASADGNWHAADVSIACTASDAGSGLANPADASFQLTTTVPAGSENADAATGTRNVCDLSGNCATAGPIGGNKIDRKAPTLNLPAPITVTATGPTGATVAFSVTATDGADASPDVECSPPSGAAFAITTTTVTCSATDDVGNLSNGSFTVKVAPQSPAARPVVPEPPALVAPRPPVPEIPPEYVNAPR